MYRNAPPELPLRLKRHLYRLLSRDLAQHHIDSFLTPRRPTVAILSPVMTAKTRKIHIVSHSWQRSSHTNLFSAIDACTSLGDKLEFTPCQVIRSDCDPYMHNTAGTFATVRELTAHLFVEAEDLNTNELQILQRPYAIEPEKPIPSGS